MMLQQNTVSDFINNFEWPPPSALYHNKSFLSSFIVRQSRQMHAVDKKDILYNK